MLTLLTLLAALSAPDPSELVRAVQRHYRELVDLRAQFVQRQLNRALGQALEERGEVYFQKPRRMRWEYREPEIKLFVSDGERAWWYLPGERQVQLLTPDLERIPTLILVGGRDLLGDYTARWAREAPRRSGNRTIELIARAPAAEYPACVLEVDPSSHRIERLLVDDAVGNRAEYRFEQARENPGLDAELFQFSPPAGVEVIELR
jgi:outer membrane lipoprotein carrier protein